MVVFWRGWGILVLFAPLVWMLVPVFMGYHEPDRMQAAAMVYRVGAAGLAVATLNLWLVTRWRERVAPGVDQFTFIPMKYWTPVIALGALAALVHSGGADRVRLARCRQRKHFSRTRVPGAEP